MKFQQAIREEQDILFTKSTRYKPTKHKKSRNTFANTSIHMKDYLDTIKGKRNQYLTWVWPVKTKI